MEESLSISHHLSLEATQGVFYIFSFQCTVSTSLLVISLEMWLQIEYLSAWGTYPNLTSFPSKKFLRCSNSVLAYDSYLIYLTNSYTDLRNYQKLIMYERAEVENGYWFTREFSEYLEVIYISLSNNSVIKPIQTGLSPLVGLVKIINMIFRPVWQTDFLNVYLI